MDAIELLTQDHRRVDGLFEQYEQADEDDYNTKRKVVDEVITALSLHSAMEERVFYPAVREIVPDAEDEVLEGLEEHHIVKWTLSELQDMEPGDERFNAKVTVLIEAVRHHVEEEEEDLFPQVRDGFSDDRLAEIGEEMEQVKQEAPHDPRPREPDTPQG